MDTRCITWTRPIRRWQLTDLAGPFHIRVGHRYDGYRHPLEHILDFIVARIEIRDDLELIRIAQHKGWRVGGYVLAYTDRGNDRAICRSKGSRLSDLRIQFIR